MHPKFVWWMIGAWTALYAQQSLFFRDDFAGQLKPGWQWMDPKGDCVHSLEARQGYLRIAIPPGSRHDMYNPNNDFSAPRLTREVDGDFTIETKLTGTGSARTEGGLLVWKDYRNFVRFDRGVHFKNELNFAAAVNGRFLRGAIDYVPADPVWLRLERSGSIFRASYSVDGSDWHAESRTYVSSRTGERINWEQLALFQEKDFEFQPATGAFRMDVQGPLQVGISMVSSGDGTAADYDYFEVKGSR